MRVRPSSTIRVQNNTYSVSSRLIGEQVDVRLHAEHLEVWYAQRCVDQLPRLRGRGHHRIEYRHIIDWLVRKPGAFANYRYRDDLFPTSRFRMAYDSIGERSDRPVREYLQILELAAKQGEASVDGAIASAFDRDEPITFKGIKDKVLACDAVPFLYEVQVTQVELSQYDALFCTMEVA
ncbi:MAG: hypothetical protein DHS20C21_13780 [Gemmatimonadota bacterium]|nr:MAG: hypothetical protein DHS20C21_13780 [Gemmatimonadota bacterium]